MKLNKQNEKENKGRFQTQKSKKQTKSILIRKLRTQLECLQCKKRGESSPRSQEALPIEFQYRHNRRSDTEQE